KRAYCLKTQPATGETYPKSDLFNKATGYSNLNLVTALDVDEIKIDKSLTSAIGTESLRYDLLPGLHEMFRSIADKIVFEGVETQEQVNYLKTFWPQSYAQGWYYSRALPLEEAKKLTIRELN
ncbi:EAL domain-containing protein, partial [Klebsiella pneumoniae]